MKDFLTSDYKEEPSKYMRFKDGENRFRILDSAVFGSEGWSERKPVRWHLADPEPQVTWDISLDGKVKLPKRFWAMPVYNYEDGAIQILEITQAGIRKSIQALLKNPKWGSVFEYDIVITRSGEGFDTEYMVTPDPKEKIDEAIVKKYKAMNIDLDQLFTGGDPFGTKADKDEKVSEPVKEELTDDVDPKDIPF